MGPPWSLSKSKKKNKMKKKAKPKAAKESRNWEELPEEVTAMILQKLRAVEILEVAQKVCTTWRKICKDPVMWRTIDMWNSGALGSMPYDLEKMAMHAVDRSCGQLVDINLEYFATDDLLHFITQRTSQLTRLQLVCCHCISDEGLSEVAEKLPLLEELHIYFSFGNVGEEGTKAIGRSCPLLKSFGLSSQWYGAHPSQHTVNDDFDIDAEALAVAQNMPQLRHLQLFGNTMTNKGLQAILDGCPHLECLDIRQCFNISLGVNLGYTLVKRIKDLRLPYDSTKGYGFSCGLDDFDSQNKYLYKNFKGYPNFSLGRTAL